MRENVFQIIKAVCLSLAFALIYALVFTLIVQLSSVSGTAIKIVNQVFKVVAIAVGAIIFIRGEKGLLKGAIAGLISVILTYILFSAIACSFTFSPIMLLEPVIGAAAGGITGIIAVNLKKQ